MRPIIQTVFSFSILAFLIYACVTDVEDPTPPPAPEWVYPSEVGTIPPEGVRAVAGEDGIHLEWQPFSDNDIAEVRIYRADSAAVDFECIGNVREQYANIENFYEDFSVPLDTVVYYYLRVVDKSDNRSKASDTLQFTLLQKSNLDDFEEPPPSNTSFSWNINPPESSAGLYCIDVADASKNSIQTSPLIQRTGYAPQAFEGWTVTEPLTPGNQYFWRVYAFGLLDEQNRPHAMSISGWRGFEVAE